MLLLREPLPEDVKIDIQKFSDKVKQQYLDNQSKVPQWTYFVPTTKEDHEKILNFDW